MLNAYVILSVLFIFKKPKISIANFLVGKHACGTPRILRSNARALSYVTD